MPDSHKNFAVSAVATAPSPATSGTSLVVTAGHGTRFPTVPFNATIWPTGTVPDPTNAEIVRVTAISTDTLTITRAQESTSARTVIVGDLIAATITVKTLTDIENVPMARAYHNADQSSTTSTQLACALNSERFDTDAIHDTSTNNSRMTCKTAGKYDIKGHMAFAANATGLREIAIRLNGTTLIALDNRISVSASRVTGLTIATTYDLVVNDYVELIAFQDSGGALNVVNAANYSPELSIERVGP